MLFAFVVLIIFGQWKKSSAWNLLYNYWLQEFWIYKKEIWMKVVLEIGFLGAIQLLLHSNVWKYEDSADFHAFLISWVLQNPEILQNGNNLSKFSISLGLRVCALSTSKRNSPIGLQNSTWPHLKHEKIAHIQTKPHSICRIITSSQIPTKKNHKKHILH